MRKLWGRKDGSNVMKVTWCLAELGLDYERIDWGGPFGGNDNPAYRAINPMGKLPTLEEEGGFALWESGAIIRYLCAAYSPGGLCPDGLRERAQAEKWMDWSSLYFAKFNTVFLDQFFRRPAEERDDDAVRAVVEETIPLVEILEAQLAKSDYLCGPTLTMADIPAGVLVHRWITWTPADLRPRHPAVDAWYARLSARPAYAENVIAATNARD